jgi:hypothetical protein
MPFGARHKIQGTGYKEDKRTREQVSSYLKESFSLSVIVRT